MSTERLLDKISDIILAQLVAFSLAYDVTLLMTLDCTAVNMAVIVAACIVALFLIFRNRKTTLVTLAFLALTVTATVIYVISRDKLFTVIEDIKNYINWLGVFIKNPSGTHLPLFEFITALAVGFLISLFAYCFIVRKLVFPVVLTACMALFIIQWNYDLVSNLVPFYICLTAMLALYVKFIYLQKISSGPNEYAKPMSMAVWSIPFCVAVIVIAASVHASEKPIEWEWMDKKIIAAYNYFKNNFIYETYDYFSLSESSGFGDSGHLGGKVRLDRTNVMQVTTDKRIYLKGASRDVYTGSKWTNSTDELKPAGSDYSDMYDSTAEMLIAMKALTGNDHVIDEYFEINPVTVRFLNISTKSLFLPYNIFEFKPSSRNLSLYVSNTGDYSSDKKLSKGFRYDLQMYSPKIGSKEFEEALRRSRKGFYENYLIWLLTRGRSLELLVSSYININVNEENASIPSDETIKKGGRNISEIARMVNEISENELAEKYKAFMLDEVLKLKKMSDEIYEKYLQLPASLPKRVRNLATSIVSSCTNDFDKAKAIEEYLASNFSYDLEVPSTPGDRDFVDYFLFELKKGYCTYYASAMAILARCAGLPARYAEGYILSPEPVKNKNTTYIISNMQAHAWVEIYFEGYGWFPFEPTPPYRADFYKNEQADVNLENSYNKDNSDYIEMMKRYSTSPNDGADNKNAKNARTKLKATTVAPSVSGVIMAVIITVIGLLILFNAMKSRYLIYKYHNLPPNESIQRFYTYYIKVLGFVGLGLKPAETPLQYSLRVDSIMYFGQTKFRAITDIFVKSRYGPDKASESEKQLVSGFYESFLKETKSYMGRFRYFILKYLLGKL